LILCEILNVDFSHWSQAQAIASRIDTPAHSVYQEIGNCYNIQILDVFFSPWSQAHASASRIATQAHTCSMYQEIGNCDPSSNPQCRFQSLVPSTG